MKHIFFVPGIFGSELKRQGRTIWPPSLCKVFSDAEVASLKSTDVTVGDVVSHVSAIQVYGPLMDAIRAAIAPDPHALTFTPWPYDWRVDLTQTCASLEATLNALPAGDEIVLLAHSMGGLIVRGCLEAFRHQAPAWLSRVSLAAFLATPHDGAINAISTVLGLDTVPGLTRKQSAALNSDHRYPAGYQLIPGLQAPVLWSGAAQEVVDFATDPAWQQLGLDLAFKPIVAAFRTLLDPVRRPSTCRYVAVVSASHSTSVHMMRDAQASPFAPINLDNSGDGTVPIKSATALPCQTMFVTGSHVGMTKTSETHAFVIALLGVPQDRYALHIELAATVPTLSISPEFVDTAQALEVVLKPAQGVPLAGRVAFLAVVEGVAGAEIGSVPVNADAAHLEAITFKAPAMAEGQYLAQFIPSAGLSSNQVAIIVRPHEVDATTPDPV